MKLSLILILTMAAMIAGATPNDGDSKNGYFWYEDPPEPIEKDPEKKENHQKPSIPSHEAMMDMHPDDLHELLEETRKYAVYSRDVKDVVDYYRVQDAVRRKAAAFTSLTSLAMLQNPELNARSQYAVTTPGKNARKQQLDSFVSTKLAENRSRFALGFFVRETCGVCAAQRPTLQYFQDKHGWIVQEIDIDERPDIAHRFNVRVTPMIILIERGTSRWQNIAVGAESLSMIEQNTYRSIRLLQGDVDPQQFYTNEATQDGFFDPGA